MVSMGLKSKASYFNKKVKNRKVKKVQKVQKEVSKIQNPELLKASRKAFSGNEVKTEDLKRFLDTYTNLKGKGELSKADKRATKKVISTFKKLVKEGRLKNV